MAKVKLHRISNLEAYSVSMSAFAEHYREDFQKNVKHFHSGLADEQGTAINAFFDKLNEIQTQIFETYPTAIENCAKVVSTYAEGLKGAGFPEICWTNDDGISSVKTKLTSDQVEKIESKRASLAKIMDAAAAEAGVESLSSELTTHKTTAENDLTAASTKRQQTHTAVSNLFDSFVSGLDAANSELSSANALINRMTLITSISAKTYLRGIQNGVLTADKITNLELITTKEEARAYGAHLNGDYDVFFRINPDDINDDLYDVVTDDINEILISGNTDNIEKLQNNLETGINLLITTSSDNHKKHLRKIEEAGKRYSKTTFAALWILHQNGIREGNETYDRYVKLLAANQHLRMLWKSLSVTGLRGQSLVTDEDVVRNAGTADIIQRNYVVNLKYSPEGGFSYNIRWERYKAVPDNTINEYGEQKGFKYTKDNLISKSNSENGAYINGQTVEASEFLRSKDAEEITKIKLENAALPSDFASNLLVSGASAYNPLAGLFVGSLVELSKLKPDSDYTEFAGKQGLEAAKVWAKIKDSKVGSNIVMVLNESFKTWNTYQKNLQKIDKVNDKLYADLLGYKGDVISSSISPDSNLENAAPSDRLSPSIHIQSVEANPYNIEASERYRDLEAGIKDKMVYTGTESLDSAWNEVDNSINDPEAQAALDYLKKGTNSGKSLRDLDYSAFTKVRQALEYKKIYLPWETAQ